MATKTNLLDVTISAELLNHYRSLRMKFPYAFIMISENGMAKALYDDAFKAYDIIHDGTPVIFTQHPLSESKKDRIAVFEIPEGQIEDELPKLMSRNTELIVSRLNERE